MGLAARRCLVSSRTLGEVRLGPVSWMRLGGVR